MFGLPAPPKPTPDSSVSWWMRTPYLESQADLYRKYAEKATYGQLGPEFRSGINSITNYLSGAGPMADSGFKNALMARLAGDIYNRASGQIGSSTADFLRRLLEQRQAWRYGSQSQDKQNEANKKGFGDYAAQAVGAAAGAYAGGGGG